MITVIVTIVAISFFAICVEAHNLSCAAHEAKHITEKWKVQLKVCQKKYKILENAVFDHMNAKGHDRCWLNDLALYKVVKPEVDTMDFKLPELPEFMNHCALYWQCRQPGKVN